MAGKQRVKGPRRPEKFGIGNVEGTDNSKPNEFQDQGGRFLTWSMLSNLKPSLGQETIRTEDMLTIYDDDM